MRRDRREQNGVKDTLTIPVEIRKVRTFHAPDGRRQHFVQGTPDRIVSVPMPLIRFGRRDCKAVREIVL